MTDLTVVVPVFNESENVAALVAEIDRVMGESRILARVLFVDDSFDTKTVEAVHRANEDAHNLESVDIDRRVGDDRTGGLSGAVVHGFLAARQHSRYAIVMDGDLQHPPAVLPELFDALQAGADVSVASRYCGEGGDASGLDGGLRKFVSSASTLLARSLFPRRVGAQCTDPMTGFFGVDLEKIAVEDLHPRGFKILLEVLARQKLVVTEVPFSFGERNAGESKASMSQGIKFLQQLADLRFPATVRFMMVGLSGVLVNLGVMAALMGFGAHYLAASIWGTVTAVIWNFLLTETLVFHDRRAGVIWKRFIPFAGINATELAVRSPLLALLVSGLGMAPLLANALLIGGMFVARYFLLSKMVYRQAVTVPAVSPIGQNALIEEIA
jgi:dolichol-phosphate mannosyltransferase